MQQQRPSRFRSFLLTPAGKALLIAVAILATFASTVYVSTLVAIPAILLFGLAVPIWAGLKRPRFLALTGLVIILLVAPISNIVITQDIMTPIPASASSSALPNGANGSVLQSAIVTPYVGGTSQNFTWEVTVYPQYLPGTPDNVTQWINLYVSTCPGATGNSSPNCATPYPYFELNLSAENLTAETDLSFHAVIGTVGIWDWQMSLAVRNTTTGQLYYIFLVGDPTYNGIEGPVVGTYATTYESLLLTLYFDDFLFLGAPFYFVLLIYMILKRRERTKLDAQRRAAGPVPPDEQGPSLPAAGTSGQPPASKPVNVSSPKEGACPSCGAVVYAGEKTCWKCGAPLTSSAPASAPLPSQRAP